MDGKVCAGYIRANVSTTTTTANNNKNPQDVKNIAEFSNIPLVTECERSVKKKEERGGIGGEEKQRKREKRWRSSERGSGGEGRKKGGRVALLR